MCYNQSTVEQYFVYDYTGQAFVQLGTAHVGALLVIAALVLAGWRMKLGETERRAVRWGLAGLLVVNELGWHAWHVYYGLWSVKTLLPLNLCNLMVFASAWTLLQRSQVGYEFIYLLGTPAASQVLITPALGPYGFPHILFFQIFISHGGVVLASLYLTLGEGMRPRGWQAVWRVIIWTLLYSLLVFGLNQVLGSNYLFLAYKPPAATLMDYLGPWPWYCLSMAAIGVVLVILMYIPFVIEMRRRSLSENFR